MVPHPCPTLDSDSSELLEAPRDNVIKLCFSYHFIKHFGYFLLFHI